MRLCSVNFLLIQIVGISFCKDALCGSLGNSIFQVIFLTPASLTKTFCRAVCSSLRMCFPILCVFLFSGTGLRCGLERGELMENVKPACTAASTLTCADCRVTSVVLPWAQSWNPISLLGYGACFRGLLWKLCPATFSKLSIIPLIKPALFSPRMTWVSRGLGAHRLRWHIYLITLDPGLLSQLTYWLERGSLVSNFFIKHFSKITAGKIKCH